MQTTFSEKFFFLSSSWKKKYEEITDDPAGDAGDITAIYTASSTGANDVEHSGIVVTLPVLDNHSRIGSAC